MSMSQEEIESLMNGLDFGSSNDEESTEDTSAKEATSDVVADEKMSEDDINNLIAETEDIISKEKEESEKASDDDIEKLLSQVEDENKQENNESIDELLNSIDNNSEQENEVVSNEDIEELLLGDIELATEEDIVVEEKSEPEKEATSEESVADDNEDIDLILKELENNEAETNDVTAVETETSVSETNIDDLLASIDGITDDEDISTTSANITADDDDVKDIDDKISKGLFPLPVEDDTKVVNQLSIVANDSEEKATKIFDVLSNILDYNTEIQNDVQALASFNEKQLSMLTSLSAKFPNINSFKQNLEQSQMMNQHIQAINDKLNLGNTEIFQAMELMQYHDINRQKIERVMSVIRKLTTYLNNLFEDSGGHSEVAVAKHIHGDSGTDDLMAEDDLEALIAEFNK